ncbi:MAG: aminotransferase class I/II-fold pyridoxal phosphate-dependent enzyme, partial [Bacteroidota bacterium]
PALVKQFAESVSSDHLVFIDEAYTEYADLPSLASLALAKQNIIVAKTFSKVYGLAGARVGYAIAHPDTIKRFASLQSWPDANISAVSASAAMSALDDQDFVKNSKQKTEQAKEICYAAFKQLQLEYIPSSANFILFNIDKIKGDLTELMKAKNIYVQHREHFGGRWCRVTMGTLDEMGQFIKALKELA